MRMRNIYSTTEIRQILKERNMAPLKSLGQNFLIDRNTVEKIVDSLGENTEYVLEVGPGLGALTTILTERVKKVVAIDIDKGMVDYLRDNFSERDNVEILHEDFLKADLNEIREKYFDGNHFSVIGNLPYYITSKCLLKILDESSFVDTVVVMIQKEVAERLAARAGDKEYGALGASLSYYGESEMLFTVGNSCFYPEPEVESAIIRIYPEPRFDVDREQYSKVVRAMFNMRRKTISNNLKAGFGIKGEAQSAVFEDCGISGTRRAETLTPEDFAELTRSIYKFIK